MNSNSDVLLEGASAGSETFGPIRIWHVDDHDHIRRAISELVGQIEPRFCFEREFPSPEGLLDALAIGNPPDVILMDIQMGYYDGLDSVRPVKTLVPGIRVLMLTSLGTPETKARARREGASDFLLKSWSADEIRERIIDAMSREPILPIKLAVSDIPVKMAESAPQCHSQPTKCAPVAGWVRGLGYLRSILGFHLTKTAER